MKANARSFVTQLSYCNWAFVDLGCGLPRGHGQPVRMLCADLLGVELASVEAAAIDPFGAVYPDRGGQALARLTRAR